MNGIRVPVATYRIQFNLGFRFVDARDLVPYLNDLGITDLYASPRFKARRGSSHGYDVADPVRVNSELGTEEEFEELVARLKSYRMGLLLDIVPNHMAASSDNPWWLDLLENGPGSPYASYFDIDWHPAITKAAFLQQNRVLLPILGDLYGNVLENQELTLKQDESGFYVRYFDTRLPLDPKTYRPILEFALKSLPPAMAEDALCRQHLSSLIERLKQLPSRTSGDLGEIDKRRRDIVHIKQDLWHLSQECQAVRSGLDESLNVFNGVRGASDSFNRLDSLLGEQAYRLGYWKLASEEINYRRFFDVTELVGVRVEVPRVFDARHFPVFDLIREGNVTGLRVDHIDGLRDPLVYLQRLQAGTQPAFKAKLGTREFFVVVEKILAPGEPLNAAWQVCGATGYEFLNLVNGLFVDPAGLAVLRRTLHQFTGEAEEFPEVSYQSRKQVMRELFAGEINYLAHLLARLAAQDRRARDVPFSELRQAIVEVTACLSVYRTYIRDYQIPEADRKLIEEATLVAARRTPTHVVGPPAFAFLRDVLLQQPGEMEVQTQQGRLDFVLRWQQITGAVMAKGVEDTAFYRYFALISLNEVGGNPGGNGTLVEEFHRAMQRRQQQTRFALSATSTHDTKRSEDVRARMNVLSEFPTRWERGLRDWSKRTRAALAAKNGAATPELRDEVLLYQTLLGAWPFHNEDIPAFRDRIKDYMIKAVREAKMRTSWLEPNAAYEQAITDFTEYLLTQPPDSEVIASLRQFQHAMGPFGALNSLSQTLLKITCPGVPDFYQGSELWDLSLVDPDNRRRVEYNPRLAALDEIRSRASANLTDFVRDVVSNWQDGRIKLFVTRRALEFRRSNPELFSEGEYLPIDVQGRRKDHVCAFARRLGPRWCLVVVPRLMAKISKPGELPADREAWRGTALILPEEAPRSWMDVYTENLCRAQAKNASRILSVREILATFPIALLSPAP